MAIFGTLIDILKILFVIPFSIIIGVSIVVIAFLIIKIIFQVFFIGIKEFFSVMSS